MDYYTLAALVSLICMPGIGIFLWWLRKNDDYWEKRGIPYVPRMDIIRTIIMFLYSKPLHEHFLDMYKTYGRIHGGFEFRTPNLTIADPDLLRDILVKDFHIFNARRDFTFGDPMMDKIVFILKGEDWKRVRTIITPAFTSKRMRQMCHIINECSKTVMETFAKHAEQKKPVDCKSIFGAFTMDVIASAAFATKINSLNDPENIFVKNVKDGFTRMSLLRFLAFFFLPTWITVKFRLGSLKSMDFFRDVILQVIKERKESGKRYDDFLQLLLDAQEENEALEKANEKPEDETDQFGSVTSDEMEIPKKYKSLSEDEIVAQCVLFFMVGYETTASVISYVAYSLALNPECQDKLIKEVDEAVEKHEELNYDVIHDMKYLDLVVSETLRMYPSLTRSERTACEDYKLKNTDITIEKGTIIGFPIHAMHHDPEFFPNPETFDPERFTYENASHHPYVYLPFGAGPRNCLGMRFALMEIKLCISNVLRHYRFAKAETTKVPLDFTVGQGLLSVTELPLLIEKRN